MHILTLLGSPRRKGNTAEVLGCFSSTSPGRIPSNAWTW